MSKSSHPCPAMLACPIYTDVDFGSATTNHSGSEAEQTEPPFCIGTFNNGKAEKGTAFLR